MNADGLYTYMYKKAEEVNELVVGNAKLVGWGFAVPIPEEVVDEEVKKEVDRRLIKLRWSMDRVVIRGREHYVLFPFG